MAQIQVYVVYNPANGYISDIGTTQFSGIPSGYHQTGRIGNVPDDFTLEGYTYDATDGFEKRKGGDVFRDPAEEISVEEARGAMRGAILYGVEELFPRVMHWAHYDDTIHERVAAALFAWHIGLHHAWRGAIVEKGDSDEDITMTNKMRYDIATQYVEQAWSDAKTPREMTSKIVEAFSANPTHAYITTDTDGSDLGFGGRLRFGRVSSQYHIYQLNWLDIAPGGTARVSN